MAMEQVACEDLKAFERRLTEIISSSYPSARRWRLGLLSVSLWVAVAASFWLADPDTAHVPFHVSLTNHPFFTLASLTLCLLFVLGVHRRVVAPAIFVSRSREVLNDFAMDCDESGKLILKPRSPSTTM